MRKYNLLLYLCVNIFLTQSCNDKSSIIQVPDDTQKPDYDKEEYSFESIEYRKKQNGSYLSWSGAESQETRFIDGMNWFVPSDDHILTAWGGRTDLTPAVLAGKNGFFRVGKINGRHYLIDPDDGAVILHGIQFVRPGKSEIHRQAFNKRFGDETSWSKETSDLISENRINYISYGSDRIETFPNSIRKNLLHHNTQKIAYAEILSPLRSFMWDMYENLGYNFEDDKYNRLVLLFEPTFITYIDKLIQEKVVLFSGDKHFVGYYLDNELPFASYNNRDPLKGVDLKHFLDLPDRYEGARKVAEQFMRDNDIAGQDEITSENQEEFRAMVADYYYRITTETIRKYDAEHLILGSRLHDWSKYNENIVKACARYCDIVSINYYGRWQPEHDFLTNLKNWCEDKPFLVSEFYTKSEDAGYQGKAYDNMEGGGWIVHTQDDRGKFYQNFCTRLLEVPNCIGWVHFEYNDGCSEDGQFTNKGIVSVEYEPYTRFLYYVKQLNSQIYALIDYYDNPLEKLKTEEN